MPRLAANLSYLWQDLPYLDRISAASDAGFEGVEILFPYHFAAKETQRALLVSNLLLVSMNAPPPNYAGGARGFAAIPGGSARFRQDLRRALRYCAVLRVPILNLMVGAAEGPEARATLVENLRWASGAIPDGLILTIGLESETALTGSFLASYHQAAEIIEEVGAPSLGLQFDSCAAHSIHGDAAAIFTEYGSLIKHISFADAPERTSPGAGQVDFDTLRSAILAHAYDGWISAAFSSVLPTEKHLGWMAEWT